MVTECLYEQSFIFFSPANVPAPCGVMKDCSALADGSYPDRDQNCHSYYTCYNKKFFGHSFCSAGIELPYET